MGVRIHGYPARQTTVERAMRQFSVKIGEEEDAFEWHGEAESVYAALDEAMGWWRKQAPGMPTITITDKGTEH